MKLKFNDIYFITSIIILFFEIIIVIGFPNGFVRYTLGDYLVVILLFCLIKSFIKVNSMYLAISVLLFAFLIEFLQLANLLKIINLEHNYLAKLILGSTFQISDLIAYTLGIITILCIEFKLKKS